MSTRAYITVGTLKAGLYRHSDGYTDGPHGVLTSLLPFAINFTDERGADEHYFLARLVENQIIATNQIASKGNRLIGFGIIDVGNGKKPAWQSVDCAFHYHVDLENRTVTITETGVKAKRVVSF